MTMGEIFYAEKGMSEQLTPFSYRNTQTLTTKPS